jgi:peptidoglycan/LPS O-acetylase OafA/YrhL
MAILVGAVATVLVCALAAAIGIILRYMPILMSGLLVLAVIAVVWYYSSTQPAVAREWGRHLWDFLRGTATSLVNRVFRRNPQVRVHLILWYFSITKLRYCGDSARE